MAVQGDLNRSELSCDVIEEIDSERGRMPTREDVRALLEEYQDNLFYFNFCFNTPPPPAVPGPAASPRTSPIETGRPKRPSPKSKKIVNFLWEKYRLYKLKSTRGQPHTLSRSMYLGLLRDGGTDNDTNSLFIYLYYFYCVDLNRKKEKIYDLIGEAKTELLGRGQELNIAKVHVIPTQAIIYDREQEQQDEKESVISISSGEEEEMEEEVIYISSEDERDEDDQTKHSIVIPDEVQEESESWIDKDLLESLETLQMELLS